jgi:phage gpG-like protein
MKSESAEEFAKSMEAMPEEIEASMPEVLHGCEPFVAEGIHENFAQAQSPDGIAWPPRKDVGDGHALLFDTGSLYDAATGGAGNVCRIEGDTLIFGVDKSGGMGGVPGAGVHNYGFGNVPQREFLGMPESTEELCGEFIADEVLKKIVGE